MPGKQRVVTIGSATGERVLIVDPRHHRSGAKHTVPPSRTFAGGSAINHACRLLASGIDAVPIGPVCRDATGEIVLRTLDAAAAKGGCDPVDPAGLFLDGAGLATPFTTIISAGTERTLYTELSEELFGPFEDHLVARLGATDFDGVSAAMIGHVHADRQQPPGRAGRLSERVIRTARARGRPVFVNFGSAQYQLGPERWETLLPEVSCFQLSIDEARTFLAGARGRQPSLAEILDWFATRCTAIITLERMGAVGRRKGSPNVVLSWPYEVDVVDTTGAGDAFAAGVTSAMGEGLTDDGSLRAAMERGALFAARACSTQGGADDAPSAGELEALRSRSVAGSGTEVATAALARRVLRMLDREAPPRS